MLHGIYSHLMCLFSTLILSILQNVFPKVSLANSSEIKVHSNYVFFSLTGEISHFLYHFFLHSYCYLHFFTKSQDQVSPALFTITTKPVSHKNQQNQDAEGSPQLQLNTGIHSATLRANNSDFCIHRANAMSPFWSAKLAGDKI